MLILPPPGRLKSKPSSWPRPRALSVVNEVGGPRTSTHLGNWSQMFLGPGRTAELFWRWSLKTRPQPSGTVLQGPVGDPSPGTERGPPLRFERRNSRQVTAASPRPVGGGSGPARLTLASAPAPWALRPGGHVRRRSGQVRAPGRSRWILLRCGRKFLPPLKRVAPRAWARQLPYGVDSPLRVRSNCTTSASLPPLAPGSLRGARAPRCDTTKTARPRGETREICVVPTVGSLPPQ